MQDRFKFRVWHKKRKKMYDVLCLHTPTWSNGGEWVTVKGFNIITQQDIHIQIEPKDSIVLQCTGLKDKNGKLIYEGDIVKFRTELFGKPKQIIWDECHYILKNTFIILCNSEIKQFGLEIIGNIYENPELLED